MSTDHAPIDSWIAGLPVLSAEDLARGRTPFSDLHPWQFKALFPYGWAVSAGWHAELASLFNDIAQFVTDPIDRQIFSWRQVKEKFGGLRAYVRVTLELNAGEIASVESDTPDVLSALRLMAGERLEVTDYGVRLVISKTTRERIFERIEASERRCDETCEICGAPGALYREGWHRVRCPEHATHACSTESGGNQP